MEKITFYYDLMSQPCRSLYIFLSVNKIPFIKKELQVGLGEHRKAEYAKVNPLKLVPAITCGNFNLTESVAIVKYLSQVRCDVADCWYPHQSQAQARVDEFLAFHHIGLRAPCALYFRAKWLDPAMKGKVHSKSYVDLLTTNMMRACDVMEKIWLGGKPYICGDTISVADIFAACELEQLRLAGYEPGDGRPELRSWMERVRRATNPYYDEAHSTLYGLTRQFKGAPPSLTAKH